MSEKETNHEQESVNISAEPAQQTFEEAMNELEQIVDQLETGEVPLEKAIQLFQKGMELSKACHEKLQRVEKQVQILVEENGELVKKEFRLEEEPREY